MHDVIIVGGSYAGISAALQLARARRLVRVIDGGTRRNRFAASSHGFLGQDGRDPAAIVKDAKAQLMAYPTVTWVEGNATTAEAKDGAFTVQVASGDRYEAKRLLLAAGVVDELPDIPGVAERWGSSIFHCPYCHGYELDRGRIGVIATMPMSTHQATLLPEWGETTYFTRGLFEPDDEARATIERRGVTIDRSPIVSVEDAAPGSAEKGVRVRLEGGRLVAFAGLFLASKTRAATPLARQLGCAFESGPVGDYVQTDAMKETTVRGLFACGDIALPAGSVAFAVGDGAAGGFVGASVADLPLTQSEVDEGGPVNRKKADRANNRTIRPFNPRA